MTLSRYIEHDEGTPWDATLHVYTDEEAPTVEMHRSDALLQSAVEAMLMNHEAEGVWLAVAGGM